MSIKDIELFHGAVLAKLMRSHRPVALSMIETKPAEGFFYTITDNRHKDDAIFYIKHRTGKRGAKGIISWHFNFAPDEIKKLRQAKQEKGGVYVALVCALENKEAGEMQIAFFDPSRKTKSIERVLDFQNSNDNQAFTINDTSSGMLIVNQKQAEKARIAKSALDKWVDRGT